MMVTMAKGPEYAGVAEIADEFGVTRTNVSMWDRRRRISGFPDPIVRLAAGPIYDMREVRAWYATRGRKQMEDVSA